MILRTYQSDAVSACWDHIRTKDNNPCVVIPTGGGKSLVLAQLAHDIVKNWQGRAIILAHVKELLEQNYGKLQALSPDLDIGIYSAGLNRRDRQASVLVAGIHSVYQKAFEFEPFDIAIVDEAHLIPPDGDGMYRKFLEDAKVASPHLRVIGMTATPYRMSTGWICEPENILNEVCYEIGVKQMIQDGWLSKLISKEPIQIDTSQLHIRGGEFVQDEATALMADVVAPACQEILARTEGRRSVLVFCQSIDHAAQVTKTIRDSCLCRVELVTGDTPSKDRAEWLSLFKCGQIKYLVNVNVLTTGFDAPNVDCVCLLRPTLSPGLYYQMVGRGFRLSPGKENCLVLDFAGNVRRHGPIDQIEPKPRKAGDSKGEAPTKNCPDCYSVCHAGYSVCPDCNYEFPDRNNPKHDANSDTAPITSLETVKTEHPVLDVMYFAHRPKDGRTPSMRVDYKVNPVKWYSEWICFEHEGYAKSKAIAWWRARSPDPVPDFVDDAVELAKAGALALTERITVQEKAGDKFPRIVLCKIGSKPERVEASEADDFEFPSHEPEREFTDEEIAELPF